MNKIFKNIVATILMTIMLFMVVGLQLHYHTCGNSGQRTFQIIETPECACEATEVSSSCCHTEHQELESCCSMESKENHLEDLSINALSCCQDDIFEISLKSSFINSISNNLSVIVNVCYIHDYVSISQRIANLKNNLEISKLLLKIPRDFIITIIQTTHLQTSNSDDYFSY